MNEWYRKIKISVETIDAAIKAQANEALTLENLAKALDYSPYYMTRKFHCLTGMSLREYLYKRKLAFALLDVRDTGERLIDIAFKYGFSSHEAFTRAFKNLYGISPANYRNYPVPVVLCSKINPLDRYLLGNGGFGMLHSDKELQIYFTKVPAHKFLHIKNYESEGYMDFWEKQDQVPGQDCDTICGLFDSIKGKLDGDDNIIGQFSGQVMGYPIENDGRRPEAYGIRLAPDYSGPVPNCMLLLDVPECEYIVFEHGPFDFETQGNTVFKQLDKAIREFKWAESGYQQDTAPGRIAYYYHDPERFLKRVLPVKK